MSRRWGALRSFLPSDLTETAVRTGAVRRFRAFRTGEELLLAALSSALPGQTFESAARVLGETAGIRVSGPGLFLRFRGLEPFLQAVFTHLLGHTRGEGFYVGGKRVVAVDATMLAGPGADRSDQVLHVVYDLSRGLPEHLELTDGRGGETLRRHPLDSGTLVLADRGYGNAPGAKSLLESGASMLLRFEFESMRLLDPTGRRVSSEAARGFAQCSAEPSEMPVWLEGWDRPLRALAYPGRGGKPLWLLTDLEENAIPLAQGCEVYARRWQVELFFKRLKSLLDLDELPTRDGPSARPWIWAKLVLAALAVLTTDERFSPCPHEP